MAQPPAQGFDSKICCLTGIILGMRPLPEDLPDDPVLLKKMLLEAFSRQDVTVEAYETYIVDLKEQIKLLRDRIFGRKSEQTAESNTPQLALFNEPESEPILAVGDAD